MIEYELEEDLPMATLSHAALEAVRGTFTASAQDVAEVIVGIAQGREGQVAEGGKLLPYTKLQFDAAKYVLEYALGKPTADGTQDPWKDYLSELAANDEPSEAATE